MKEPISGGCRKANVANKNHISRPVSRFASFALACAIGTMSAVLFQNQVSLSAQPTSTTANYGDWVVRCTTRDNANTNAKSQNVKKPAATICEMAQVIKVQVKGKPPQVIAQVAVGSLRQNDQPAKTSPFKLVIQVPAGVYLRAPVTFASNTPKSGSAKNGKAIQASYMRCLRGYCLADSDLSDDEIGLLKSAGTAQLGFVDAARRKINLPVSLKGFADAFEAMRKR